MSIFDWFSKEEINQLLLDIVSIESHKDYKYKELEVAQWIKTFFEKEQINVKVEEVEKKRPNVIASLENNDKKTIKLMFNGHIDTVPGFDMNYPAFEPFIKKNNIYGRGTADMKGAIIAMMVAFAVAKRSHLKISENIIFTGVVDEEEASIGAEDLVNRGYKPEYIILGEPTQLDICTTHKGMEWVEITFHGKSGHASRPSEGNNAVYAASDFCQVIETELQAKLNKVKNEKLGSGSVSVGRIAGGNMPNIIPASCTVEIDRRWLPEENLEEVNNELFNLAKDIAEKRGITFSFRIMDELTASMGNHPYNYPADDGFLMHVTEITEKITGTPVEQKSFPAWSDAGILGVQTDAKCLILGPGNIDQAHAANEYCSLEEIYQASEIYFNLIQSMEETNYG